MRSVSLCRMSAAIQLNHDAKLRVQDLTHVRHDRLGVVESVQTCAGYHQLDQQGNISLTNSICFARHSGQSCTLCRDNVSVTSLVTVFVADLLIGETGRLSL